jgi:ABC-type branched-subunit amino acid transport system ATPase component
MAWTASLASGCSRCRAVLLAEQRTCAAEGLADWTTVLVSGVTRPEGRPAELLARPDFDELFMGAGSAGPGVISNR